MTSSVNTKPKHPTRGVIRRARKEARLTQEEAAALIDYSTRAWQEWERGHTPMHRAIFRYFLYRVRKMEDRKRVDLNR